MNQEQIVGSVFQFSQTGYQKRALRGHYDHWKKAWGRIFREIPKNEKVGSGVTKNWVSKIDL
jgi:hypothetical protein